MSGSTRTTDTKGMNRIITGMLVAGFALLIAVPAWAGDACGRCRGCKATAAGAETPCGDTGCGPRYWGAVHDEPGCPDPCDACGRWRDCHGMPPAPEKFAPWQLPPGRGFQSGAAVGYASPPCSACRGCGPRLFWPF